MDGGDTRNAGSRGGPESPAWQIVADHGLPIHASVGATIDKIGDVTTVVTGAAAKPLPDREDAKLPKLDTVPYFKLYRYADWIDIILIVLGTAGAAIAGSAYASFTILFGDLTNAISEDTSPDDLVDEISKAALKMVIVGVIMMSTAYLELSLWTIASERQVRKIRVLYFKALLRQDVGYFDAQSSHIGEVVTRVIGDTAIYQDAIGDKVANIVHNVSTFIAGLVIGFYYGWQMTLVMLAMVPMLGAAGAFITKVFTEATLEGQKAFSAAGGIVQEAVSGIRTVASFTGEERTERAFGQKLLAARKAMVSHGFYSGIGMGLTSFIMFGVNALAFWFGGLMIAHDKMSAPDVLKVFVGVLLGGFAIGQASPNVSKLVAGKAVGATIFAVIDKQPAILSDVGEKLPDVTGAIDLVHVSFRYPARPDVLVFDDFNLSISPGQMVALVGESGSGKSTIVSLIERFYDPEAGSILVDGRDIKSLNLKWLRRHIGLVSQEPVLFGGSIRSNIMYGKEGATEEEVLAAAKAANAHNFIVGLPEGYDTQVGERGVKLSGGQKQRVAIARAILMEPKILLLDEATSALDSESERLVQEALDRSTVGRTTLVIAHRLSTIRHADVIAVMRRGKVIELGSHDELMAAPEGPECSTSDASGGGSINRHGGGGVYRELVRLQCMPVVTGAIEGDGGGDHDAQGFDCPPHDASLDFTRDDLGFLPQLDHRGFGHCTVQSKGPGDLEGPLDHPGMHDDVGDADRLAEAVSGSLGRNRADLEGKAGWGMSGGPGAADSVVVELSRGAPYPEREGGELGGGACADVASDARGLRLEAEKTNNSSTEAETTKSPKGGDTESSGRVKQSHWRILTRKGEDASGAQDAKPEGEAVVAAVRIPRVSLARIFSHSQSDWPYAVVGVAGAAVAGGINPAWGFFFAELIAALFVTDDGMLGEVRKWSYVFLGLAGLCFLANVATIWPLGMVDANLIYRLRRLAMTAILRQDMAFFDDEANTSGALAGRIENDTQAVRALVGDRLGIIMINLVSTAVGFIGALVVGWKLALVTLSIFPLMVASETIQGKFLSGVTSAGAQDLMGPANQVMSESVSNIRTVAAFTAEYKVLKLYERHLARPFRAGFRRGQVAGISYGFSNFIFFCSYALCFWYGGRLIQRGEMTFDGVLKTFFLIVFGAMAIGQNQARGGDIKKAREAADRIFYLLDLRPRFDRDDPKGATTGAFGGGANVGATSGDKGTLQGAIELRQVSFAYPRRPGTLVFDGFSLDVPAGRMVALVGESGSGKSTIVSLIERFYDPVSGSVRIDGVDVRSYNLKWLRQHIGLVSQEPVLFAGTIRSNILYGKENASAEEVEAAARAANAHNFVVGLPDGYETDVGERGTQLSGGQKQRIAIARAILKDPRILLLDEATSALDSESERLVQDALDRSTVGRTTLVIAHRLSTIRHADVIAVVQKGKVVETGTHRELLRKGGAYASLAKARGDWRSDTMLGSERALSSVKGDGGDLGQARGDSGSTRGDGLLARGESVLTRGDGDGLVTRGGGASLDGALARGDSISTRGDGLLARGDRISTSEYRDGASLAGVSDPGPDASSALGRAGDGTLHGSVDARPLVTVRRGLNVPDGGIGGDTVRGVVEDGRSLVSHPVKL